MRPHLHKPRLRGRFHQVAFFVSIPAGIALVAFAQGAKARVAATIFAASLTGLYGVSAAYHRGRWSLGAERLMKHLDHSMIFVLIAGSYTPIALLALRPAWGITLLALGLDRRSRRDPHHCRAARTVAARGVHHVPRARLARRGRDPRALALALAGGGGATGCRWPLVHGRRGRARCATGPIRARRSSATTRSGTRSSSVRAPAISCSSCCSCAPDRERAAGRCRRLARDRRRRTQITRTF